MKGDTKYNLINGHSFFFSHTKIVSCFSPSITFFYQELIFTFSFIPRFQKLLSKTFIMMLLKQISVCKIVTWQPFLHKGHTPFKSVDVGSHKCSGSCIFSSWAVVAGGGTVTFVAQQEISGLTRCTESAAAKMTFSKTARLLVPFLLLHPFPWLHATNMSSLVLSLRLILACRTRPLFLP